jgi:hypothetical protein
LLLLGANCLFFLLHFWGNQLSYELAKKRFANAFEYGNLSDKEYYSSKEDMKSVRNLVGIEHFIECQIAAVILGGSQSKKDFFGSLEDAVILKYAISSEREWSGNCSNLKAIVVDNSEYRLGIIKTRYQWGYKAIYAILLQWFSVFQIRELTKVFTYFAYLVLSLMVFSLSRRLFLIFSPVIILGFFFSSIPQFPTLGNALGYLWSLITAIVLVWQMKKKFSYKSIRIFTFVAGMISSYVWFLDGHLSFIFPLIGFLVYFGLRYQGISVGDSYKMVRKCLSLFVIGFLASHFCNQILKVLFSNWEGVIVNTFFKDGVLKKLTHVGRDRANIFGSANQVSLLGMETLGSIIAGLTVLVFIIFTITFLANRWKKSHLYDFFFLLSCILYIRLALFFPHDNTPQLQRFVFLLFAFVWSYAIWIFQSIRDKKNSKQGEGSTSIFSFIGNLLRNLKKK